MFMRAPPRPELNYTSLMLRARAPATERQRATDPILVAMEEMRKARLDSRGIPDQVRVPLLAREGFPFWVQWVYDRVRNHWDAVVVITGPEGSGKSSLALRLAVALDPTFTVERLCYTALDVMTMFKTLKPGQAFIFDESARALMGTDTHAPEQKALVQALMLVRERNLVTIMCIPRLQELAKSMRSRRSTMWMHVVRRGTALIHLRDDRLNYDEDPKSTGFIRNGEAPLLEWQQFPENSKLWQAYLAYKHMKLNEYLEETEALLEKGSGRGRKGKPSSSEPADEDPQAGERVMADAKKKGGRQPGEPLKVYNARRQRALRLRKTGAGPLDGPPPKVPGLFDDIHPDGQTAAAPSEQRPSAVMTKDGVRFVNRPSWCLNSLHQHTQDETEESAPDDAEDPEGER